MLRESSEREGHYLNSIWESAMMPVQSSVSCCALCDWDERRQTVTVASG